MRFSRLALIGAVLAMIAAPRLAPADTLVFSTSGYFGATPGTTTVASGGDSLSFVGMGQTTVTSPSNISLGDFFPAFSGSASSGAFDGDIFTLVITQFTGGVGTSHSIASTVSGSLSVSNAGTGTAPSSTVAIDFGGKSTTFAEANGNIATYTPFNVHIGTQDTTLQGSVTSTAPPSTPLPKSAYATAGLLALIALRHFSRRFFVA